MRHRSDGGTVAAAVLRLHVYMAILAARKLQSPLAPIQNEGGDGGATQCATAQPAADGPSSVHARRARFGRGERRCREPAAGDTLPLPDCQRGLEDAGGAGRQLALAGGFGPLSSPRLGLPDRRTA